MMPVVTTSLHILVLFIISNTLTLSYKQASIQFLAAYKHIFLKESVPTKFIVAVTISLSFLFSFLFKKKILPSLPTK